jgi:putative membrane protein
MQQNKYNRILLAIFFIALILSAIKPHDYFTCILKVAPALVGLALICYLKKHYNFEFTRFILFLLLIHLIVLMI